MEVVVDSKWVQGFPPLMPRQVEVHLTADEAREVRSAAQRGELFVRMDTPEGERVAVQNLWVNPHDPQRMTFILKG